MHRLDFIIYHSAALCRDWASLYIILSLYAETGLHYISFCRRDSIIFHSDYWRLFIIYHSAALCRDWASLYIIKSSSMQRLDFIIYHSTSLCRDWASIILSALCRDWASLYIILSTDNSETVLHYISFCMQRLGFII